MLTIVCCYIGGCFSAGFDLKALSSGELDTFAIKDPQNSSVAGMVSYFH